MLLGFNLLAEGTMRLILLAWLGIVVAACSQVPVVETLLTSEERALVRGALNDVSRNDQASLAKRMRPELRGDIRTATPAMKTALPGRPYDLAIMQANVTSANGVRTASAVYRVKGGSRFALVEAVMTTDKGQVALAGLHVQSISTDPIKASTFKLADGGPTGWAMILAMAAALGVTVAALFRIWRSGLFGKRWLWTIGALFGFTTLKMTWVTGEFSFHPVSFQFLSVSAFKAPVYAPWVLGLSVPAVALIALFRRRRVQVEDADLSV